MILYTYFLPTLILLFIGTYLLGSARARQIAVVAGGQKHLHSLPTYYGILNAFICCIPALIIFFIYQVCENSILTSIVKQGLPEEILNQTPAQLSLIINDIQNTVSGNIVSAADDVIIQKAADRYLALQSTFRTTVSIILLAFVLVSVYPAYGKIDKDLRARNIVENIVKYFLIACSAIAILTTIGIVFSVLFEAIRFF